MDTRNRQPWISSAAFDSIFILSPPLIACLFAFLFFARNAVSQVGPLTWLLVIVGIDVAHVYGSVFRTYFDPQLRTRQLLWTVPIACWGIGTALYAIDARYFWMGLAYLAVYHFVRQQYGFAMIYGRADKRKSAIFKKIDQVTIYTATLYPLLFWHTHPDRHFSWFTESDFLTIDSPLLSKVGFVFYCAVLVTYLTKEIWLIRKFRDLNVPRNLLILGTALSWYIGIVWFNNDLAFTVTNVVAHGIPYLALVWIYGHRKSHLHKPQRRSRFSIFAISCLPAFIVFLLALAYFEEALWDGFIWREHTQFFPAVSFFNQVKQNAFLIWLVPLLALPQSTHYVFDAFLWRSKGPESGWKRVFAISKESHK